MSPLRHLHAGSSTLSGRPARFVSTTLLAPAALLLSVALAGCAGGGGSGGATNTSTTDRVATLTTVAPSNTAGPGEDRGRPQLRLDMSEEEKDRYWTTYKVCLRDHGVQPVRQGAGAPGPFSPTDGEDSLNLDQSGEPKAAYVACAGKLPLQPVELDPEKNPQYADQWNNYIHCLREHGIKLHATSPGNATWDDDVKEAPSSGDYNKWDKQCTMEVFGGKK
ncbi:hypothetical protein ACIBF5_04895 [Micromonospora sp. NPDC050417]|uniref:hypothetical protein n=1 Tax=Micromonospora sp. NPDC050417 TaxID=3364280 RepID=UPI0037AC1AF6